MPAHDGFGRTSTSAVAPVRPDGRKAIQNSRSRALQAGPTVRTLHRHQLLAQRQVLQDYFAMSTQCQRRRTAHDHQQLDHVSILAGRGPQNQLGRVLTSVSTSTGRRRPRRKVFGRAGVGFLRGRCSVVEVRRPAIACTEDEGEPPRSRTRIRTRHSEVRSPRHSSTIPETAPGAASADSSGPVHPKGKKDQRPDRLSRGGRCRNARDANLFQAALRKVVTTTSGQPLLSDAR